MKLLIILIIFLSSYGVWALNPEVGHYAKFQSEYRDSEGNGGLSVYEKTILKGPDFRGSLPFFLVEWSGRLGPFQEWVLPFYYIQNTEDSCDNPSDEVIQYEIVFLSVMGESFKACKRTINYLEGGHEIMWLSDQVPFGVLKRENLSKDGSLHVETLVDFER